MAAQGGQKEPRFLSEGRAHTRALRVGRAPIQGAEWRGVTDRVAENLMSVWEGRGYQTLVKNEGLILSDMEKH